jgi:aromatic ring-cleaving dioxygenase
VRDFPVIQLFVATAAAPRQSEPNGKLYVNKMATVVTSENMEEVLPEMQRHFDAIEFAKPYMDVHVYWEKSTEADMRIVYENMASAFPEMQFFDPIDRPVGPHLRPMFEGHLTPDMAATVMRWMVVNGRGLPALFHPNTKQQRKDHTEFARWVQEALGIVDDFKGFSS